MTSLLIALNSDPVVNKGVSDYLKTIKVLTKETTDVYWFKKNEHLITLNFISDIEPEQTDELIQLLIQNIEGSGKISSGVERVDYFPNSNGKILVTYFDLSSKLKALHKNTTDCLGQVGLDAEQKSYKPHITLARYKHIEETLKDIPSFEPHIKGNFESIDILSVSYSQGRRKFELIKNISLINRS